MKENPIPVKYSGNNLREAPLTSVKVNSFLQEFLDRQRSGLSGNFRKQKYPFDSCLWQGVIKAGFWELDYKGLPRPIPGPNRWWPYEQTGYLLDGLLRLGLLTGDQEMVKLFEDNLDYLLSHADNGRLAGKCYGYESEWPMGVFFWIALMIKQLKKHFKDITIPFRLKNWATAAAISPILRACSLWQNGAMMQH